MGPTQRDRLGNRPHEQEWRDDARSGVAGEIEGIVKFFDAVKGFGFVAPDGGGRNVFLHGRVLDRSGLDELGPGRRLRVMVVERTCGPQATYIKLI